VQAARQQEGREAEALRLSLTVEVRRLVNILLETHRGFGLALRTSRFPRADDVNEMISGGEPLVFPAVVGRVGLLGRGAPDVLRFYANLKDLGLAGRMTARDPAEPVPPDDLRHLMRLIEQACQSALPLLDKDATKL
jgi:hypothetical protein